MKYNDFFKLLDKGDPSGAYLLHGTEEFVKESAVSAACGMIPEDMRAFNLNVLYDAGLDRIIEACETLPVFVPRNVVIVRELSSSVDAARLTEYCSTVSSSTLLLIVKKGKLEERSALLKHFVKLDRAVEFSELSETEVIKWCMKTAVKQGAALDQNTARLFVGLVGVDMTNVRNELQKAIDIVGPGGTITPDIISLTTVSNIEYKLFSTLDLFTAGKVKDGMTALKALLEQDRDAPLSIAGFLESRFRLMLIGRLLMDRGLGPKAAANKMDGSAYANEKACRAAVKYSAEELTKLVSDISLVGYNRITGGEDPVDAVLKIMVSFNWLGSNRSR